VSGYLTSKSDGESIAGARIKDSATNQTVVSNPYGFYSLQVPPGKRTIIITASGMVPFISKIDVQKNEILTVEIFEMSKEIEDVFINGKRSENTTSTQLGQIELEIDQLKTLPAFMGEVDIIKTIQMLPGVQKAGEGGQGFYVRGGGPDQNLVLLDEALVYNASHLFGFFSVFNSDAIKTATLTKGGMPANFGGRTSSVLEISMNEGNSKRFQIKGGIGVVASRLTVEGPINKGKGSFIVSGRRTYIDPILKYAIPKTSNFYGSNYYFYDLNAKVNYRLGPKDKLFFSSYYGKDKFIFDNKKDDFRVDMPWGNGIAALRWNHLFTSKLFMNTSATLTDYLFSFGSTQDKFAFKLTSGIRDYGGKVDLTYLPNNRHKVKFGTQYTYHIFTPTSVSAKQDTIEYLPSDIQRLYSHEAALYVNDEWEATEKIKINVGLRYSAYAFVGPFKRFKKNDVGQGTEVINYKKGEVIQFYHGLEPRISGRFMFKDKSSFKAGYSYNYQYVHLASLSAVSLPTDIWFPSTDLARPQRGWQATMGYFRNFLKDNIETSVEVYYKQMYNLIEYKQGAVPADNISDNPDNLLVFGKGRSFGLELFIKKNFGKLTGWLGYTLSKTERYFPEIQATWFPAKYDRRHDISVVAGYKLNERWTFGANFMYATGNTMTLPSSWYVNQQQILYEYTGRNTTRMAPYHRFDISATLYDRPTKKIKQADGTYLEIKKRFRHNWNFSIYNVYSRANPFFLYIDTEGDLISNSFKLTVKQVSLFPIIPAVTWNFEF
jgi:hypothetical protein